MWCFQCVAFRPLAGPTWSASVERTLVKPLPPRRPHAHAASLEPGTSGRTGRQHKRWNETPANLIRQTEARIAEGGRKGKAEREKERESNSGQKPQRSPKTKGKRPFFLFAAATDREAGNFSNSTHGQCEGPAEKKVPPGAVSRRQLSSQDRQCERARAIYSRLPHADRRNPILKGNFLRTLARAC